MDKITPDHLSRLAYVYIRQSSLGQLQHNPESRRVQERLLERAQALGWSQPRLLDEDLGYSACGVVERAGFERLLAAVCAGEVGAIFAFEASRLARNGREWHTLLEMCAVVDTVIVDTEAVYDPKLANDRLLLGVKGTLSELEVGLFRARCQAAVQEKAQRGEYYSAVAVGYRKSKDGKLEKEPDLRVQRALESVFEKFPQFGSARQLVRWLRQEGVKIPRKEFGGDGSPIVWCLPTQSAILSLLRNPVYAGAYTYGRSKGRTVLAGGRKPSGRPGTRAGVADAPPRLPGRPDSRIGRVFGRCRRRGGSCPPARRFESHPLRCRRHAGIEKGPGVSLVPRSTPG